MCTNICIYVHHSHSQPIYHINIYTHIIFTHPNTSLIPHTLHTHDTYCIHTHQTLYTPHVHIFHKIDIHTQHIPHTHIRMTNTQTHTLLTIHMTRSSHTTNTYKCTYRYHTPHTTYTHSHTHSYKNT